MKQKIFYLGIVLLAGMFSFISCSKDDDDSDNTDGGNEFYEKGVATVEGDVVVYKLGNSTIKYYFEGDEIVKTECTLNCLTEETANIIYQEYLKDPDAQYLDLKKNGKYLSWTDDSSTSTYSGLTKEQLANLLNNNSVNPNDPNDSNSSSVTVNGNIVTVQTLASITEKYTFENDKITKIEYTYDCGYSSVAQILYQEYLEDADYENVTVNGKYLYYSATEEMVESYNIQNLTKGEWIATWKSQEF